MIVAINKELSDQSASLYVLSSLMRTPLLLEDERYVVTQEDFTQPIQQMFFTAIFNMTKEGVEKITPADIDMYLKTLPAQYAYYEQHKGYPLLLDTYKITEQSDPKQFDFFYNRLKKFSILRDLNNNGFNIKEFYDTDADFLNRDLEDEKLNGLKVPEITNRIREILVSIEDRHVSKEEGTSQAASKGLRELVQELKSNPEIGLPLDGDILNIAVRGARLGKLYVYSAPSGMGKSRFMVGNACAISLPYIEDKKIKMRDGLEKVLFVATEMSADEIQTMILAYVSGVNEEKILLGNYSPDEQQDIALALDIIEKYSSNFIIESMPDPSRAAVRAKLTKYIIQNDINYIFYDYIFSSPGLLMEFRDLEVREDVALMMMSNTLKEIAMSYQVFIQTATQLNGNWEKTVVRNANLIRGSKAIVDKVDIGIIAVRLLEEERNSVKDIIEQRKDSAEPNVVLDLYKNRRGKMTSVKIFRYFDYGTCRTKDLFITDDSYRKYTMDNGKMAVARYNIRTLDKLDRLTEEVPDENSSGTQRRIK